MAVECEWSGLPLNLDVQTLIQVSPRGKGCVCVCVCTCMCVCVS